MLYIPRDLPSPIRKRATWHGASILNYLEPIVDRYIAIRKIDKEGTYRLNPEYIPLLETIDSSVFNGYASAHHVLLMYVVAFNRHKLEKLYDKHDVWDVPRKWAYPRVGYSIAPFTRPRDSDMPLLKRAYGIIIGDDLIVSLNKLCEQHERREREQKRKQEIYERRRVRALTKMMETINDYAS